MLMTGHDSERKPSRSMSYTVVFAAVTAMILFLCSPSVLQAHPPKDVSLTYDAQKQVLTAVITHSSFFPTKHYVKSVNVSVNGKSVKNSNYTSQPSGDTFTYEYPVAAVAGDEISVEAKCNMFGSREAQIKVSE